MHTFEITVQRRSGDRWHVVAEQGTGGLTMPVRIEGELTLDLEGFKPAPPEEYGSLLGRALFRDGIRDAFSRAVARSEDLLHVLLFVEADDLRTLRWERLCAPADGDRWGPLALEQRTPFSLYLPSTIDRQFPPFGRRDLRALVVAA